MPDLRVHLLPEQVSPDELSGRTSVVIDVLRATTTIVYALGAGARAVVPCLTIDDARESAARLPCGLTLLAGERGGLSIPGFDLGNSPGEFTPDAVSGRYVVLTTTNGTKALLHCRHADRVFPGAFANISALCHVLSNCHRVDIVCAGTDGQPTEEDLLMAGAIVERLVAGNHWKLNEAAHRCRSGWLSAVGDASGDALTSTIACAMSGSRGGRNLRKIGFHRDIEIAARMDVFAIAPQFDATTGRVVV